MGLIEALEWTVDRAQRALDQCGENATALRRALAEIRDCADEQLTLEEQWGTAEDPDEARAES